MPKNAITAKGHAASAKKNFRPDTLTAYDFVGLPMYISDVESYEILYENKAALAFLRIDPATLREAAQDVRDFGVAVSAADAAQIERTGDAIASTVFARGHDPVGAEAFVQAAQHRMRDAPPGAGSAGR